MTLAPDLSTDPPFFQPPVSRLRPPAFAVDPRTTRGGMCCAVQRPATRANEATRNGLENSFFFCKFSAVYSHPAPTGRVPYSISLLRHRFMQEVAFHRKNREKWKRFEELVAGRSKTDP